MRINDHFKYLNIGLPEDILRRKMNGDFEGAIRLIDRKLVQDIPEAMRSCLIVQREIISRVEADYPYTKEEAIAILKNEAGKQFDPKLAMLFIDLLQKDLIEIRGHRTIADEDPADD